MTLPELPFSEEFEQHVLGCLMGRPDLCARMEEKIRPDLFHDPRHREILRAIVDLHKLGRPVEVLTVIEELKSSGKLQKIGGPFFIDAMTDAPIAEHIEHYLDQLEAYAARRAAVTDGLRLIDTAGRADVTTETLMAERNRIAQVEAATNPARVIAIADLMTPPANAEDELICNRFLCRSGAAMMFAQSGIGKSSLRALMAYGWASGVPVFGMRPARPLRQLIIQAENDEGDEASFRDGVRLSGLPIDPEAEKLVRIAFCQDRAGTSFLAYLETLLRADPIDLVWIDPLLSFLGADVNSQVDVSAFLRNGLQPILARHNIGCIIVHHTAKPLRSSEKATDMGAYIGAGSAELTNYPRAVMTLECTQAPGVFKLRAPKRGGRLGWDEEDGAPADFRLIAHSGNGRIYWRDATKEEAELALASAPKTGRKALASPEDAAKVLDGVRDGLTHTALCKAVQARCGCGVRTAKGVIAEAKKAGLIRLESGIYTGECKKCN